jgi:hypothetical protein
MLIFPIRHSFGCIALQYVALCSYSAQTAVSPLNAAKTLSYNHIRRQLTISDSRLLRIQGPASGGGALFQAEQWSAAFPFQPL